MFWRALAGAGGQGALMSTIRDVARLAGVSTATVSATLSGTTFVSEPLRARVRDAVEQLNYSPHGVARSLKRGSTRLIGLVIPDVTNPFLTEFVQEFGELARGEGYSMLLCDTGFNPDRESEVIEILQTQRVDGIVASPGASADTYSERFAIGARPAVVLVDNAPADLPVDSVVLDNYGAAFTATSHLLDRGHVRVATVAGPSLNLPGEERIRGFGAALAARGIVLDPRYIVRGNFLEEDSRLAVAELLALDTPPSAIFAAGNLMLVGVMRGLREAGLSVPADISVAAIDDFPWATAFSPTLTTVRQPVAEMAEHAMRLLSARMSGDTSPPTRVVLAASLLIRDSVAAPAKL
jgi:DNA-binding LacI/PurR family transcriptional regulator